MRWPWSRRQSGDQLVVSWHDQTLSYVLAHHEHDGSWVVRKFGVERQGADSTEDFVRRLQDRGLKGYDTRCMLRPGQYQLLQIDAPAVPPDELRAAARYQIRELLQTHVDDVTIDVMRVGDGQQKGAAHLFVVAATNAVVRSVTALAQSMQWTLQVIDIQETAQRNLQNALAEKDKVADRANATLVLIEGQQAVLTISANEELFYTRCFDLPESFLSARWGDADDAHAAPSGFAPVQEYVPDYSVGGVSYGSDYSESALAGLSAGSTVSATGESTQRFLVEVQRSLDVWDRTWSSMPLYGMRVFAGTRSGELAQWLTGQLGQRVVALEVHNLVQGLGAESAGDFAQCCPLLGVLLRSESRKL